MGTINQSPKDLRKTKIEVLMFVPPESSWSGNSVEEIAGVKLKRSHNLKATKERRGYQC